MEQQNLDQAFRASELIVAYLKGNLTDQEQQELDSWVEESNENRALFSELTNPVRLNEAISEFYLPEKKKKIALHKLRRKLFTRNKKIFGIIPFMAARYVAAAAFLGVVATGIYFISKKSTSASSTAATKKTPDIVPGDGNQVVLTLADGTKIQLDSSGMGLLAQQNGTEILKQKDGQVIYQSNNPSQASMNSIITPKGKQHELILPDGSRVWLNALSKIDFPTAFTGKQRNISLSGEAYFDVVTDKSRPFHVNVDGMDVKVTGTQFNVNAYKDETTVKSTLFEGGVKVTKDALTVDLMPGQQLQMDPKTKQFKLVKNADLEATAAWKDGVFYLNNIDVAALMRQAARWYDIEVEYPNGVPSVTLFGEIDRNTNLSELMKVLNESGIKTRLDGKTLQIFQ
jgi:transmembrane sensor